MRLSRSTIDAFFALLRAGLWERSVRLLPFSPIDFNALYQLAEEQSVVGVIAAGLEHVEDMKVTKQQVLPFMKSVISLEGRNVAMNNFIAEVVGKMRDAGIETLLIKGQGVARWYARPLWRSSGDIDFLLDESDYHKAMAFLRPLASLVKTEGRYSKHLGMTIGPWLVEIHGSLRTGLSSRVDRTVDAVHDDTFSHNNVYVWKNGGTDVHLPGIDNDIFFVFSHFIKHFYKGGICLRQVCDLCRMYSSDYESVDRNLLYERLKQSNLVPEWCAFSAFAVDFLGVSDKVVPLYEDSPRWHHKAIQVSTYIMKEAEVENHPRFSSKIRQSVRQFMIFPQNTLRFLPSILFNVNLLKIKERFLGS